MSLSGDLALLYSEVQQLGISAPLPTESNGEADCWLFEEVAYAVLSEVTIARGERDRAYAVLSKLYKAVSTNLAGTAEDGDYEDQGSGRRDYELGRYHGRLAFAKILQAILTEEDL
jgi:hypothetical protein